MILLAPLLGAIALAIMLKDGRPIFYRQERVGLQGRRFGIVKFRSMVTNADGMLDALQSQNEISGHAFKMSADPADHAGRALPPPLQPRRAAAAVERPRRRDEPRRPAAAAPARSRRATTSGTAAACR